MLRGKIIEITSRLKKFGQQKQEELENKIKELEKEHKRAADKSTFNKLKITRDKLDDLLTFKAEGSLRFINQKYYEMGNRASRLLAFQLRKAQTNRIVSKIKHPASNQIMVKPKEIASFADYYRNLYDNFKTKLNDEAIQNFLNKINLPTLSDKEATEMIQPISTQELLDTIKTLKFASCF